MKKVFHFGKIDYYGRVRRINAVDVEVELKEKPDGLAFSACGEIWNGNHSDVVSAGQNLDEIAKYIHNNRFSSIYAMWQKYHLNDMRPECEHQRELGWPEKARQNVTIYTHTLNLDTIRKQHEIKRSVMERAKRGKTVSLSESDRTLLSLKYEIKTWKGCLPEDIASYYKIDGAHEKTLGWIIQEEHPEGLLCRPCPVCGYRYGTAWKYMPIEPGDLQTIKSLMEDE